jgi:hypothetical protein
MSDAGAGHGREYVGRDFDGYLVGVLRDKTHRARRTFRLSQINAIVQTDAAQDQRNEYDAKHQPHNREDFLTRPTGHARSPLNPDAMPPTARRTKGIAELPRSRKSLIAEVLRSATAPIAGRVRSADLHSIRPCDLLNSWNGSMNLMPADYDPYQASDT